MRVEIYKTSDDGISQVAGVLHLHGDTIVPEPADSRLLLGILRRPAFDASGVAYLPNLEPAGFLGCLHQHYTSPYLRASKVIEGD